MDSQPTDERACPLTSDPLEHLPVNLELEFP